MSQLLGEKGRGKENICEKEKKRWSGRIKNKPTRKNGRFFPPLKGFV